MNSQVPHLFGSILYASRMGLSGLSNHYGRRVPSGPGAGRVFAIHSL